MPNNFANIAQRISAFIRGDSPETFEALALELYAFQRQNNPAYAKLCDLRGITNITNWQDIPAAPTVAFKELEMTSLAPTDRQHTFYSSGTSQSDRSRHHHSAASLALYEQSLWQWFQKNFPNVGNDVRSLFLILTPSAPTSSLAHMFEVIASHHPNSDFFGLDNNGAWTLELPRLLPTLKAAQQPVALLGTAFQFVHLLDALSAPLQLPKNSWLVETGGYKGRSRELPKSELHGLLTEKLGLAPARIFSEYGMSELSSQAYDHADGLFQFPPWARLRIIDPATGREAPDGEPGLIRICDLANVWSVMAIQTEDLGIKMGSTRVSRGPLRVSPNGFRLLGRAPATEARGCSLMSA